MKKLVCAAFVAAAMVAAADEAKCEGGKCELPKAEAAEAAAPAKPAKGGLSAEQRAKMREQRAKLMAERKAAMEAKMLEVVKKYVPEEEKAKALIAELQGVALGGRRELKRPPMPKPAVEEAK